MTEKQDKARENIKARTAWHPLFAELLALHLPRGYKLLSEYQLTRQPQRIDIVIWEEGSEEGPYKGLPALMDRLTRINLLEFKSPKDVIGWGDYATLVGYTGQYAARERPENMSDVSLFLLVSSWRNDLTNELNAWGLTAREEEEGVHLIDHPPWRCWVLELDLLWRKPHNAPFSLVSRDFSENPSAVLEEGQLSRHLYAWFSQQLAHFRERSQEMPLSQREEFEQKMEEAARKWLNSLPPEERSRYIDMETILKDIPIAERLKDLPPEERLKGLTPEERLQGLPAEERLKGLPAEERLKGLPAEERLKGLPAEERLKGLTPEEREKLKQLLLSHPIDEPSQS